jgi:DNA excision repair protein ERCC-2
MRGKSDYGIMLLVDKRFAQKSKLAKMPKWISKQLEAGCSNITSDSAITIIREFYRKMA